MSYKIQYISRHKRIWGNGRPSGLRSHRLISCRFKSCYPHCGRLGVDLASLISFAISVQLGMPPFLDRRNSIIKLNALRRKNPYLFHKNSITNFVHFLCISGRVANAADCKSAPLMGSWVRVPPDALL